MYLARLRLKRNRMTMQWIANPYRIHQRLKMAYEGEPRLLFRIEETPFETQLLIQSHMPPNWQSAFEDFPVLSGPPEHKYFDPQLRDGQRCRFRLLANPTVRKTMERDGERTKKRQGLLSEEEQIAWLERKLGAGGAQLHSCWTIPKGLQRSYKSGPYGSVQTHFSVLFEGLLIVKDAQLFKEALGGGIGPAKGYGFGLLSLAKA